MHWIRILALAVLPALALDAAGVPAKGTEILWDRYGVPHIVAPDHASLFYAYGYAQMEAHGDLLLRLYGRARGRGAEYFGEEYLESDRWVRRNGIPAIARAWARQQSPEFAPLLRAFAAGINGWADENRRELDASARAVLPVTTADVLAHALRVIHFDWLVSPTSLQRMVELGDTGEAHGSNGWAIAPSRSASGNTMLVSNSHLSWEDLHTYFEVHLQAPGVNSYGAVWVGFPTLRLCFNDRLGWTQTTNRFDGADLYRLTLKDGGYVLDGKVRPFETEEQTIRVRQPDGTLREERLTLRRTVHGPVMVERDGLVAALRVTALDRPGMLEQFWRMGLARNLAEFEQAMKIQQLPIFNTMYADREGHILYLYNGAIPVRPKGDLKFWSGLVPGDRSELIWSTIHPYQDLPRIVDPPGGFVQNCNDQPWSAAFPLALDATDFPPYFPLPSEFTLRGLHSLRLLSGSKKLSFEDLKAAKHSTRVELADRILDDLLAHARKSESERVKRAAEVLSRWDRRTEAQSAGALLFHRFAEEASPTWHSSEPYAVPFDPRRPLETPRGLKDPAKALAALEKVAAELEKTYGRLDVRWGDAVRFRRGTLDLPANGGSGNMGVVRTANPGRFVDGRAPAVFGDSYIAVVEFGETVRAEALLAYGNWSRRGSRHIEDQLRLMAAKQLRPVWRERKEIEANLESRKVF